MWVQAKDHPVTEFVLAHQCVKEMRVMPEGSI
jgi:hypothetical protein